MSQHRTLDDILAIEGDAEDAAVTPDTSRSTASGRRTPGPGLVPCQPTRPASNMRRDQSSMAMPTTSPVVSDGEYSSDPSDRTSVSNHSIVLEGVGHGAIAFAASMAQDGSVQHKIPETTQ